MHQHPRTPLRHVIITGGAGFIGSQISARFLKEKTRVTSVNEERVGATGNGACSAGVQGYGLRCCRCASHPAS